MSVETQYTAKTGFTTISTANSSLEGEGSLGTIFTAGELGSIIKTIIIKAQTSTVQGMVRLFIKRGDFYFLILEIPIPIITRSSRDLAFYEIIPFNYSLEAGDILLASTEKEDTFNVIAEVLDWNYGSTVRIDSTHYEANTGVGALSTANDNLNGSRSPTTILTAGSASTFNGCKIKSILIKSFSSTTNGMIRLFIGDPSLVNKILFCEIIIPTVTQNPLNKTFAISVITQGNLTLQAEYKILASTQNAERFNVIIEAEDWNYPS